MSYQLETSAPELGRLSTSERMRHLLELRRSATRPQFPVRMRRRPGRYQQVARELKFLQPHRSANIHTMRMPRTGGDLTPAALEGLGFSLKPPKAVRRAARAVKKAVTLKRVLTAGAVVGAAVVLGPSALAVGKVIGRGVRQLGPAVGRLVRGAKAVGRAAADPDQVVVPMIPPFAPNAPAGTYLPQPQPGLTPVINSADDANIEAGSGEPLTIQAQAGNDETVMAKPVLGPGDMVATSSGPAAPPAGGLALLGIAAAALLFGRR